MINAIICWVTLILANLGVEYFHGGDYLQVAQTSYNQLLAIMIYYFIWVRPEIKQLKERFNG